MSESLGFPAWESLSNETYDFLLGSFDSIGDSSARGWRALDAIESRKDCGMLNLDTERGRPTRAAFGAPASHASAMLGSGGASFKLDVKLVLLTTLILLAALLKRADLRIDWRTVFSMVSFL